MDEKLLKEAQNRVDFAEANNPAVKTVLGHVKDFVKRERVLCYGGTAINNLLPLSDRFYDPRYEVPDYDFYTETPQEHAMKLADEFHRMGFKGVEVKPGVHLMTYKVFVDFMGVADITYLHPPIFRKLWDENVHLNGIHYVTPNFLRMSMYLELSRPRGDVERWKKVYTRAAEQTLPCWLQTLERRPRTSRDDFRREKCDGRNYRKGARGPYRNAGRRAARKVQVQRVAAPRRSSCGA